MTETDDTWTQTLERIAAHFKHLKEKQTMALPTTKPETEFESFEPGNYTATLKSARLLISTEYQTDLRYQAIELIWDIDGDEFSEGTFTKVSLNERSKFYNRVNALMGGTFEQITEWKLAQGANEEEVLDQYRRDKDTQEFERTGPETLDGVSGTLEGIIVDGENIIGKTCLLNLELKDNGYNRATAGAATPLPKAGGGKRGKAAAPAGAPG